MLYWFVKRTKKITACSRALSNVSNSFPCLQRKFGLQFDDIRWKHYLDSLKPLVRYTTDIWFIIQYREKCLFGDVFDQNSFQQSFDIRFPFLHLKNFTHKRLFVLMLD